ncbi:MAG TPA: hypothetical protein VFS39_05575 [Nitrospira sp.]|nr:hypothetical protein [Nitrospira sp.]
MAERKYGQQGYRESDKKGTGQPGGSSGTRPRGMLPTRTVSRCADCGTVLPVLTDRLGQCPKCRAELHACQQCTHFAPGQRFECAQPIPDRITDKRARNDCTFFSLRATVERETSSASRRPEDARRALNDLFKK